MNWIETTNKNPKDPLTKNGQWSLYISCLEGCDTKTSAHYTITFDRFTSRWRTTWWHGNRGHYVNSLNNYKTKEEAKAACNIHFKSLVKELLNILLQ